MKKIWMIAGACMLLACATEAGADMPERPAGEEIPAPGPETGGDDDEDPLPEGEGWELGDDDSLPDYAGERADDAALDTVDPADEDFWENSEFEHTIRIVWTDGGVRTEAPDGVAMVTDGAHVAVDLSSGGWKGCLFRLSGSSSDGSLKIYSDRKFRIVLEGLQLTSQRSPALNNQSKKRTFLHLEPGTVNTLADVAVYTDDIYYPAGVAAADEDRKGALFSEGQLIVSGTGSLSVAGSRKHAVATDEYFRLRAGATVVVAEAVGNGLQAKEAVRIDGGLLWVRVSGEASKAVKTDGAIDIRGGRLRLFTSGDACYDPQENDTSSASCLRCGGDATVSGGTLALKSTGSGGKGISCAGSFALTGGRLEAVTTGGKYRYTQTITSSPKGVRAEGDLTISGGEARVRAVGTDDGAEGIESKASVRITGGRTEIAAYDDALNAATSISIDGGYLYAYSSSNDGIDSNGGIRIAGGVVIASGSRQPEDGIDCDNNEFIITGGTVVASGGGTSTPSASLSTQPSVILGSVAAVAGRTYCLADGEGTPLAVFTPARTLEPACLLLSLPSLKQGGSYTLLSGGTPEGEQWNGWYGAVPCAGGDQVASFTCSSTVTTVGGQGGGPGGQDGPGGPGGPGGGGGGRP